MYAATGGTNVKWGGTDFKWDAGHHWPPSGDDTGSFKTVQKQKSTILL